MSISAQSEPLVQAILMSVMAAGNYSVEQQEGLKEVLSPTFTLIDLKVLERLVVVARESPIMCDIIVDQMEDAEDGKKFVDKLNNGYLETLERELNEENKL